jgi:hypothetical protein
LSFKRKKKFDGSLEFGYNFWNSYLKNIVIFKSKLIHENKIISIDKYRKRKRKRNEINAYQYISNQ